jgi:hypothetical protein
MNRNLSPVQFSEWYHGTRREKAEGIAQSGLTANAYGVRKSRHGNDEHHFVLTTNKSEAADYSGEKGSVVTVRVPHDQANDYLTLPNWKRTGLHQPIPTNMIHKIEHNLGPSYG